MLTVLSCLLVALGVGPLPAPPQDAPPPAETVLAFTGAHVIPIGRAEIDPGILVIRDGVIAHVGPMTTTPIPVDARVIDVRGKVLMPGLVTPRAHFGVERDTTSPGLFRPELDVRDAINLFDPAFDHARAGGITTAHLMRRGDEPCAGRTAILKLRAPGSFDELQILGGQARPPAGLQFAGLPDPGRDMGRLWFEENLVLHQLVHRRDEIAPLLRWRADWMFAMVFHLDGDAPMAAEELAKTSIPCTLRFGDATPLEFPQRLRKAGVRIALHTDDPRFTLRAAGLAVRGGMARKRALAAITLDAARVIRLDDSLGSLEVGKDADFLVLDGDPLSVYTRVRQTWVEGEKVFDLDATVGDGEGGSR